MVQGVGFRYFAQRQATRLGVGGYTRNLADGRVEIYAVGTADQLRALAVEIARGPAYASVARVEEESAEPIEGRSSGFSIEPGA